MAAATKQKSRLKQPSQTDLDNNKSESDNIKKDPAIQNEVLSRLKKIEGQVRGVQKMVQEFRSCGDIVIQLAAIKAAVNRVGVTMLACHMVDKMQHDVEDGEDIKESINEFISIFKKFS